MSNPIRFLMALALPIALAACDDETGPDNERFVATLSAASEVPPNASAGTGQAEFEVEDDGTVTYDLQVQNMTGITAAHIHGPAGTTTNAGVLVSLFPVATSPAVPTGAVSGRLVQGSFNASDRPDQVSLDSVLTLMRSGNAYVNVHTSVNRAGEIRGQIAPR